MPVILICDICGSQESAKARALSEFLEMRKEIVRLEKYIAQQLNEKGEL